MRENETHSEGDQENGGVTTSEAYPLSEGSCTLFWTGQMNQEYPPHGTGILGSRCLSNGTQ